jgi:hypothetical protein
MGYVRIEAERAGRRGGYSRMAFLTRKGYDYFGRIDDVTDASIGY